MSLLLFTREFANTKREIFVIETLFIHKKNCWPTVGFEPTASRCLVNFSLSEVQNWPYFGL